MNKINTNRIRGIMAEKRITGGRLAELTGYSQTAISNFLRGESAPSLELARAVSQALDLSKDDIIQIFF